MLTLKKPSFLGIDFGMSRIKAVELAMKNGRPFLVNYGEAAIEPSDGTERSDLTPEDRIASLLKLLLGKMSPKSSDAYVAMPGFSGLITVMELPKMSREELDKAVRFEAQRYIPSPLNEVVLSWDIVSSNRPTVKMDMNDAVDAPEKVEVLLVAALHKEVEKYERYIASAELKMEMLELETFSLVRSLMVEHDETCLIIDIGSRSTNLILVENGFIKVNRNVNAGGHEITVTISEALNIAMERAETIKAGNKDFLNEKESSIVFPSLELVVNEARRMMAAYREKHSGSHIDHVILSGGTSKMKGMDAYFSKALDLSVRAGNPWQRIAYDEKLSDAIAGMGTSYSVAVGLALAGIDSYERG